MSNAKKPTERGRGGPSETVQCFPAEHADHSPSCQDFQRRARRQLLEARQLKGAAGFAAVSLARHYAKRAALLGGAHA